MMYYRKALMLQSYLERISLEGLLKGCVLNRWYIKNFAVTLVFAIPDPEAAIADSALTDTQGYDLSPEARAQADLKFSYVVTCQIYGQQKEEQKPEAADIALLMQRSVVDPEFVVPIFKFVFG